MAGYVAVNNPGSLPPLWSLKPGCPLIKSTLHSPGLLSQLKLLYKSGLSPPDSQMF